MLNLELATTERDPSVRTHIVLAQKHSSSAIFFGRHPSSQDFHSLSPTSPPKGKFIVLVEHQTTTTTDFITEDLDPHIKVYKVFSSLVKEDAIQAVTTICQIIKPIANILISESVLKALILPMPKSAREAPTIIISYLMMQADKIESDEWKTLATVLLDSRLLVYHSCALNNINIMKNLIENGANPLAIDPDTLDTLVHAAVKHGNQLLVELLGMIQPILPTATLIEHINRVNKDPSTSPQHLKKLRKKISGSHLLRKTSGLIQQQSRSRLLSLTQLEPRTRRISLPSASSKPSKLSFRKSLSSDPDLTVPGKVVLDGADDAGVTALMLACGQGDTLSVLYLLLYGANPNIKDPARGNTALHVAAYCGCTNIVKLLLAFNANIDALNANAKTPLDLAQEMNETECFHLMKKVKDLQDKTQQHKASEFGNRGLEESSTHDPDEDKVKSKLHVHRGVLNLSDSASSHILSLDGGGSRCVSLAYLLYALEHRMRTLCGDSSISIGGYFNWITATSMSSILAMHVALQASASALELMKIAITSIDKLQTDPNSYDSYLKQVFGDSALIESIQERNILLMTANASSKPLKLGHITNYRLQQGKGWKIYDAIRACSATTSYMINGEQYSDGSVFAMNPTLYALNDTEIYNSGHDPTLVLSLGCNSLPVATSPSTATPSNRAQPTAADEAVSLSQDWCTSNKVQFYRLSPPVPASVGYTAIYEADLISMLFETFLYCLESYETVDNIAQVLLTNLGHN